MRQNFQDFFQTQIEWESEVQRKIDAHRYYRLDEIAYDTAAATVLEEEILFPTIPSSVCKSGDDAVFFARQLLKHLNEKRMVLSFQMLLAPQERATVGERMVYAQNDYTEKAFGKFASFLKAPAVSYAQNFAASCEAVADGLADLCILPFRDERWTAIKSCSCLPENYGISIRAACMVGRNDGEKMQCVLCGRGICIPQDVTICATDILFSESAVCSVDFVREIALALGWHLVCAEALPNRFLTDATWKMTFFVPFNSLLSFLLCRRLFMSQMEILGIYSVDEPPNFS